MFRSLKINITKFIKKVFGEKPFIFYHFLLANLAAFYYNYPSKKMLTIVVTGTKGKTSTLNFLWHTLSAGGYKVGLLSTANIKIGDEEILNWYHMTMPGRFLLQKMLYKMYKEDCDIVLVEVTSEGIKNGRHIGLFPDWAIFTNLFPEHLASHQNSFEVYKNTKNILFQYLEKFPKKVWKDKVSGQQISIPKIILANKDDENSELFLSNVADKKISFGFKNGYFLIEDSVQTKSGVEFSFQNHLYKIPIIGLFNILNSIPAILLAKELSISENLIETGLKNCLTIPGRMEMIDEGQDFTVIVDYAHEGVSMQNAVLSAKICKKSKENKLIVVFGAEGGGRDLSKRITMSKVISENADCAIVTLSDPFDADPDEINKDLISKLESFGMTYNKNIFDFLDRKDAIQKAISLANSGDVILFASKGAEQTIIFKDKIIPWDDRLEVRKALKNK
jgi:UDP-N-acetylmuramoyl-L-alanyl-D-glutamate--2,6-diaminopimelate ligase